MRVQLEISEAMDIRTRQGLLHALDGKVGKRMHTLLVPLELLCCISRTEFADKRTYLRWQKRQLNMLEEGLINHPAVGFGESGRKVSELRILLRKIEGIEVLVPWICLPMTHHTKLDYLVLLLSLLTFWSCIVILLLST